MRLALGQAHTHHGRHGSGTAPVRHWMALRIHSASVILPRDESAAGLGTGFLRVLNIRAHNRETSGVAKESVTAPKNGAE